MVQADEVPAADDGAVNVPSSTPVSGDAMELVERLRKAPVQPPEGGTGHDFSNVTRFEVIDRNGRSYTQWGVEIGLSVQDAGRTLKVFVEDRTSPPGQDDRTNASPECDDSLNQALPSALPRKDVEGAASPSSEAWDVMNTLRSGWCDAPCAYQEGCGCADIIGSAIKDVVSAERSRVIEECAKVAELFASVTERIDGDPEKSTVAAGMHNVAAAIRDLGKQTGGAE